MDSVFNVPSLQRLCQSNIAQTLWAANGEKATKTPESEDSNPNHGLELRHDADDFFAKLVNDLPLPPVMKPSILELVFETKMSIFKWLRYYLSCYLGKRNKADSGFKIEKYFGKFVYKLNGDVDKEAMGALMTKDVSLDKFHRFRLACFWSLTDDIAELWKECRPCQFGSKELGKVVVEESLLVTYWIHRMEGKIHELEPVKNRSSVYIRVFSEVHENENYVNVCFCKDKITPEQYDTILNGRVAIQTPPFARQSMERFGTSTDFTVLEKIDFTVLKVNRGFQEVNCTRNKNEEKTDFADYINQFTCDHFI